MCAAGQRALLIDAASRRSLRQRVVNAAPRFAEVGGRSGDGGGGAVSEQTGYLDDLILVFSDASRRMEVGGPPTHRSPCRTGWPRAEPASFLALCEYLSYAESVRI